ncbi:acyl-CoA dehydrogenase family protein [Streptomyces antarcticus]|uniref:acyl-CoA dehydrogenase family protein n=1 Tax=Streptomyces antarcticus TaxID=2996458 RepID=UPI0022B01035|nr:acyl-CoA dehydrogenase family protein [Streptomyces sp. H34-S5]MCZ4086383.1 hypothetical protein [Streptomyces sp. H34-S5]
MHPTSVAESRLSRAARGAAELAGAQAAGAEQDRSLSPEVLGAAQGALAHWSGYAVQRLRAQAPEAPGPGPSFYEETLARTAGELDAARLLLERAAARADAAAEVTALEAARGERDCALAADLLVGAVERLFRASGTAGHDEGAVLQRLWRDIHSAAGHVVLQFGPSAAAYARHALNPES